MREGVAGRSSRLSLVQPRPKGRRRRPLKGAALLILFLGAGLLFYKAGEACCLVEEISVTGNVRLSEAELIAHSGIKTGTSLLLLQSKRAEEKLAALPELSAVAVKRRFPSTVHIAVQERQVAASLLDQNRFWLLDREGVLFAEQAHPAENLPVITGVEEAEITVGKTLAHRKKSAALRIFLEALPRVPLLEPAELNLSNPANLVLYTGDGRKVLLGDSEKMIHKLTLLQAFLQESGTGRYLDLRAGDRLVVLAE
ncbi:MAG TPA: FtsQ-type POTRA domain-containing protein [Bacillota bacterium]|nr:FtsQ-type POTRA domain-containing protein [Bacillota bacterium]HOA35146.1 FtsQ-type POTRA domain-containing protein [Bacillota bacterium]HOJ83787.1 FtsQ-type POTRA domain-containing protein [Bacillota bacterium]HOL15083.1 FtsQ-type POTRA domain-containing protein [Bacillota bacterium]HPZ11646.1 FtsQ-type POTRA domain-containing protein [Bacillota bacterium]